MSTSLQANERIVRAIYDAINRRDWDAVVQGVAPAFERVDVATGESVGGREGLLRSLQGWVAAFPDLRAEVANLSAEECRVAVELTLRGTHGGMLATPGAEIGPTGRTLSLAVLELWDLRGGMVVRARSYYDSMSLMRQLGLEADLEGAPAPLALDLTHVRIGTPGAAHRELARRWFAALSDGAWEVLESLCSARYHLHAPALEPSSGPAAARALGEAVHAALARPRFCVQDVVAEGDRASVRWTVEGARHDDPSDRCRWAGSTLWRLRDGRVYEEWTVGELPELLRTLSRARAAEPVLV